MRKTVLIPVFFLAATSFLLSQQATRWRGPNAEGIYPGTGLLRSWPENGPEMLWSFEQLGEGYASPSISGGYIYIPTMIKGEGYMFKLSISGKEIWRVKYGSEFTRQYPGTRSSATIAGDLLYMLSGNGRLVCMDTGDGSLRWSRELTRDFDGVINRYGYNETVLVDGDRLYATPGGVRNNVIALNRFTGDLVWTCPGMGEKAAYCTPAVIRLPSRTLLVTHTESHILGIDIRNGNLLWSYPWANLRLEHQNTPLYKDGLLFCLSGYGMGAVMLRLSPDGTSVSRQWFSQSFDNRMGAAVLINGYLYGSGHNDPSWQCYNWTTGEKMYSSRSLFMGAVISADGLLYCFSEKGEAALVKPDPSGFEIISKMTVRGGSGPHWAHPVIHEGVLYIPRGKALMAYRISQK
ncbi:MAG TPA: PQQ-like beta-propeller repeat protein [Bacteroidales bacterium]|jgi:outer membrane protein assembly factor BamB|nr:PQQ-like beta-propeller repeat protein [Bacteroidales bacterium]HQH23280.1 PQQ-like beta-propeller repeat protein [Bacteroidales bacterium]HQJ82184.1 PQQ-like beta-propeller repeat protein [Bacteroidales bacterium]